MVPSSSFFIWKDIERRESNEQKRLLQWQLQAREPIRRFSDMKAGDHLVKKSSPSFGLINYEHHFLCIGSECVGQPKIVHYYNTVGNASKQMIPTSLGSGTALEQLGIVQEMTLPHDDFIKDEGDLQAKGEEVERVVWPEELRRYSVEDVIKRAQKWVGENFYHLMKNNCESYVMWCLCGLNISLQATPLRKTLCEAGSAIVNTARHGIQQVPKVCADLVPGLVDDVVNTARHGIQQVLKIFADLVPGLVDDVAVVVGRVTGVTPSAVGQATTKVALPKIGLFVGSVVTVVVEAIMAVYDICNTYKKWKDGRLIESREEFIKEVADIVLLALFRSGGSIAGMIVGQVVIPIPILGGLVGALLGLLGGHVIGKLVSETSKASLARLIESKIAEKLDN